METLSHTNVQQYELLKFSELDLGYEAYNNILKIICAYSAYSNHFTDVQNEIIKCCTNKVYVLMWTNWLQSKTRR